MRISGFAALLSIIPSLLAARPLPPVTLEPAGNWGIDYGANRCTLYRVFGSGRKIARLSIEQTEPRSSMSVMVAGSALPHSSGRDNVLTFEPLGGAMLHGGQSVLTSKAKENAVYFTHAFYRGKFGLISDEAVAALAQSLPLAKGNVSWLPGYKPRPVNWAQRDWRRDPPAVVDAEARAFGERAATVQSVVLNPRSSRPVTLHTGSLRAPLNALDKCAKDSLKDWGIDPSVEATVVVGPHPANDEVRILTAADYPEKAISAGMESSLDVWLNIDVRGAITSCRVISSFASPAINDRMCKLVKDRQTFVPARTADGSPVASYYVQSFRFVLAG